MFCFHLDNQQQEVVIENKIHGSGTTALIISIKKWKIDQKGEFLSMLLGILTASILINALVETGVIRADEKF